MFVSKKIIEKCNLIYEQLGQEHTEFVYQRALAIELYNLGATLVEVEKPSPCYFKDSNGVMHILTQERIDLLAHFPNNEIILLELKNIVKNKLENHIGQVKKYFTSLKHQNIKPSYGLLINFPTHSATRVEHIVVSP
jgi:GxxExxY protein